MIDQRKHKLRSTFSVILEVASGGDYKAKLPQREGEYILTLVCSLSQARRTLRSIGYRYQAFAARKFHTEHGRDDGSYMKIDPEDNTKQFHVHLYDAGYSVLVYSHHEYRIRYPFKHYNAKDYTQGKMCERLEELVTSE